MYAIARIVRRKFAACNAACNNKAALDMGLDPFLARLASF